MGSKSKLLLLITFLYLLFAALIMNCYSQEQEKLVHVVYLGHEQSISDITVASMQHHSMLESALGSTRAAKESLIYSYGRSFNGFAAKLSDEEVARLREIDGVVSILPNTMLQLHTTRSWDFIGVAAQSHISNTKGGDVIIGMIDSGIWPESESFNDNGFGPPPKKWKGKCNTNGNFTCNNKIIGARYYNSLKFKGSISPRDTIGHGTHASSVAAGGEVARASFYGMAKGVARGGAPRARIAVYKACWSDMVGCSSVDVLAAFDDAIADGVDIISISLGLSVDSLWEDPMAIGSFHALRKGILTSTSAGNNGPTRGYMSNAAPWLLTVAASAIDRKFVSNLVLGNGHIILGSGINTFDLNGTMFPLIWGGDAANFSANGNSQVSRSCYDLDGYLDSHKIKGKIVLCEEQTTGAGVLKAGGVGVIMPFRQYSYNGRAMSFPFPTTLITQQEIARVLDYIKSSKKPKATILVSEAWKDSLAPYVPSFSSRGPNRIAPDILKPDLIAPGVNILGAWSPVAKASVYDGDRRSVKYYISGTSSSCPHVTGAAAIVKAAHPSWSPATIKSALMTTAYVMDPTKHENEREFAYGSGLVNPMQAIDPGLVFDATEKDYVDFLCKQRHNTTALRKVTGDKNVCQRTKRGRGWDLNYPSFSLAIKDGHIIMGNFYRTVTNVGKPNSTYYVAIDISAESIEIKVKPSVLSFTSVGEKKSFNVEVSGPKISQVPITSGSITWKDGVHVVRTPLVIYTVLPL